MTIKMNLAEFCEVLHNVANKENVPPEASAELSAQPTQSKP